MNDRHPLDRSLDLLVFAPVGLAVSARELVPQLAEKGRARVLGPLANARALGELVVQQGRVEAVKLAGRTAERARQQAAATFDGAVGRLPGRAAPARPPARHTAPGVVRPAPANGTVGPAGGNGHAAVVTAPVEPGPDATSLAIPGYDTLSASQVVPRLDGLTAEELDAVRRYEAAGRGRKTILNKVAQLQSTS
jgi:hypothetical protein